MSLRALLSGMGRPAEAEEGRLRALEEGMRRAREEDAFHKLRDVLVKGQETLAQDRALWKAHVKRVKVSESWTRFGQPYYAGSRYSQMVANLQNYVKLRPDLKAVVWKPFLSDPQSIPEVGGLLPGGLDCPV
ncbi:MAG: hypothetical protein LBT40_08035 [Deltaproteobacteria bacterium]|jgi:uncharacterized coiled-coil protein SlyX|nr:hypothetical protein [Deltaproteobacteria bacterium]